MRPPSEKKCQRSLVSPGQDPARLGGWHSLRSVMKSAGLARDACLRPRDHPLRLIERTVSTHDGHYCHLTHILAKKGRNASEEENGEDMRLRQLW